MAWFSRFTRFGDTHMVFGQEAGMSCGIASIIMCVFKINKLSPGANASFKEKEIYDMYTKASGATYVPETQGTHPNHIATVLNGLNCGTWTGAWLSGAECSKKIVEKVGITEGFGPTVDVTPVIAGVGWKGGGGHAMVIDTIRRGTDGKKYATVCDPWDANVHISRIRRSSAFSYTGNNAGFSVNLWGDTKADASPYGPSDNGKSIAIIYRN